jgi:hypothetical protein
MVVDASPTGAIVIVAVRPASPPPSPVVVPVSPELEPEPEPEPELDPDDPESAAAESWPPPSVFVSPELLLEHA